MAMKQPEHLDSSEGIGAILLASAKQDRPPEGLSRRLLARITLLWSIQWSNGRAGELPSNGHSRDRR
jgi:hypothetical protein